MYNPIYGYMWPVWHKSRKKLLPTVQKIFMTLCLTPTVFVFTGVAAILYECRLGCLENKIPQETQDYINALHLMFSSFKTTMYAGAIPKWLRPIIPKPWEEFCLSWDGLFNFSKWFKATFLVYLLYIYMKYIYGCLLVYLYATVNCLPSCGTSRSQMWHIKCTYDFF